MLIIIAGIIEYLICARYCSKNFPDITILIFITTLWDRVIPILQVKKLKLGGVKSLVQGTQFISSQMARLQSLCILLDFF